MKQKAGAAAVPSSLCRARAGGATSAAATGRRPSAKVKAAAQRFVLSSFVSCYGEQNACVPRLVGPEVGQRPFVKKQLTTTYSSLGCFKTINLLQLAPAHGSRHMFLR